VNHCYSATKALLDWALTHYPLSATASERSKDSSWAIQFAPMLEPKSTIRQARQALWVTAAFPTLLESNTHGVLLCFPPNTKVKFVNSTRSKRKSKTPMLLFTRVIDDGSTACVVLLIAFAENTFRH
jgi:hypothetical protein